MSSAFGSFPVDPLETPTDATVPLSDDIVQRERLQEHGFDVIESLVRSYQLGSDAGLASVRVVPSTLPPPAKKLRIAIPFRVLTESTSIFSAGRLQTPFFIHELLWSLGDRHDVVLVKLSPRELPPDWTIDTEWPIIGVSEALSQTFDVWILTAITLPQAYMDKVKETGAKIVLFDRSVTHRKLEESFIFDGERERVIPFYVNGIDAVLMPFRDYNDLGGFFEVLYNTTALPVPLVWSPQFFDATASQLSRRPTYTPRPDHKVIAIFEPNLSIERHGVFGLSVVELLERHYPDSYTRAVALNMRELVKNTEFNSFVQDVLTAHAKKKVSFLGRFKLPWFLSDNVDLVLAHQWESNANYMHLDSLHAGYPLVHNVDELKDCGYFYTDMDGFYAANLTRTAMAEHPQKLLENRLKSARCLWRFSARNPANGLLWEDQLMRVLGIEQSTPIDQMIQTAKWTATAVPFKQRTHRPSGTKLASRLSAEPSRRSAVPKQPTATSAGGTVQSEPASQRPPSVDGHAAGLRNAADIIKALFDPSPEAHLRTSPEWAQIGPVPFAGGVARNQGSGVRLPNPIQRLSIAVIMSPSVASNFDVLSQVVGLVDALRQHQSRHDVLVVLSKSMDDASRPILNNLFGEGAMVELSGLLHGGAGSRDLILDVGFQLSTNDIKRIRERSDSKVVGVAYNHLLFGHNEVFIALDLDNEKDYFNLVPPQGYDLVLSSPDMYMLTATYVETFTNTSVAPLPTIFSPRAYDTLAAMSQQPRAYFTPRLQEPQVALYEECNGLQSSPVFALAVLDQLNRENATLFSKVHVANADRMLDAQLAALLEAGSLRYAWIDEKRQETADLVFHLEEQLPNFLAPTADLVLAHQIDQWLPPRLLAVLHAGFPLVHNSPYLKDCGMYYPELDGFAAADVVKVALNTYVRDYGRHVRKAAACLWRHHFRNPDVVAVLDATLLAITDPQRASDLLEDVSSSSAAPRRESTTTHSQQRQTSTRDTTDTAQDGSILRLKPSHLPRADVPVGKRLLELRHHQEQTQPSLLVAPSRRLKIMVTFALMPNATSAFTNGAKQMAFNVYEALSSRHAVAMVNLHSGTLKDWPDDWGDFDGEILSFQAGLAQYADVWIEVGMQLSRKQVQLIKLKGGVVVTYRTGNDDVMSAEAFIFGAERTVLFGNTDLDMALTIPAFNRTNAFQRLALHCPVKVGPYVWSSRLIDTAVPKLPNRKAYQPSARTERTVGVFESNTHIVKNAMVPLVILEQLNRRHPELLKEAWLTNIKKHASNLELSRFVMRKLSIYKQNKTVIESRFKLPFVLSSNVDVVLSHQWNNELNFLYMDAMYLGYPVVHNSPYFKDCGYYYEGDNGYAGAEALRQAIQEHDQNLDEYVEKAARCIFRFSPLNLEVMRSWEASLFDALDETQTPEREGQLDSLRASHDAIEDAPPNVYAQEENVGASATTPTPPPTPTGPGTADEDAQPDTYDRRLEQDSEPSLNAAPHTRPTGGEVVQEQAGHVSPSAAQHQPVSAAQQQQRQTHQRAAESLRETTTHAHGHQPVPHADTALPVGAQTQFTQGRGPTVSLDGAHHASQAAQRQTGDFSNTIPHTRPSPGFHGQHSTNELPQDGLIDMLADFGDE